MDFENLFYCINMQYSLKNLFSFCYSSACFLYKTAEKNPLKHIMHHSAKFRPIKEIQTNNAVRPVLKGTGNILARRDLNNWRLRRDVFTRRDLKKLAFGGISECLSVILLHMSYRYNKLSVKGYWIIPLFLAAANSFFRA